MRRRRLFSDGNFAAVAPIVGESPPRFEPAEGVTAVELEEIVNKKDLTPREVMVIRQSMVQVMTNKICPKAGVLGNVVFSCQAGTRAKASFFNSGPCYDCA